MSEELNKKIERAFACFIVMLEDDGDDGFTEHKPVLEKTFEKDGVAYACMSYEDDPERWYLFELDGEVLKPCMDDKLIDSLNKELESENK